MAIDSKEIISCSRRCVIESMRISFRYSLDYPYVSALMLLLIAMYRAFPSLFAFLLSSSPVILCTAILLGFLLNYSETNEISSLKATSADDVLLTHKDESFVVNAHVVDAHVEGKEEEEDEEEKAQERGTQNQGVVEESEFPIEKHPTESHFESEDDTESSSTDASLSDIIPMLEELHPLLDSDTRDPAKSIDDGANGDAMNWTPEDQKNLMDLGTSEIERNQRLENLIAKRRARRNIIRFEAEKDLIDLNSSITAVDDLYRFRFQISPITATRRNPFDLSCDSDEITGLPAVPGSAPSVLLRERNPFDVCYSLVAQSESCERDSKFDLFPESDMASSLIDREHYKELLEEEIHQESELLSAESDSAHVEHDDHTMDLSTSIFSEGTYGAFDAFEVVEEKIGEEGIDLPVSDSASLQVHTSPPSSPEINEKSSKVQIQEELTILEQKMGDSLTSSSDSTYSLPANLSLARRDGESSIVGSFHMMPTIDEELSHTGEGDLNPTSSLASELANKLTDESSSESHSAVSFDSSSTDDNEFKSSEINEIKELDVIKVSEIHEDELSKDSLIDASFQSEGDGDLNSTSSWATDKKDQVESANKFMGEELASSSESHWVASFNSSPADENEFKSMEITEITEGDVIESSEVHKDSSGPNELIMTRSLALIPKENLDGFIIEEEHERMIYPPMVASSTGLHMIQEPVEEQELSISEKKLFEETETIDNVSVLSDGEDIVEPRESIEIASLLDMKDEVEFKLSSSVSDSRGHDFADINDLSMLSESAEPQNVAPAEIKAIEEIDEGLLSELDVVGDFCAELKSDQVDLESLLQYPVDLKASEPNAMELEAGSSSWLTGGDPELKVYNPKLHVLEASSFEELDSAFNQLCELEMLSGQETVFEKSMKQKTEGELIKCDTSDGDNKLSDDDSELQILEAKSIEDLNYAFKRLSKVGLDESVYSEAETVNLEPMWSRSEMQVIEATSIEDIQLALKGLSDGTAENKLKPVESTEEIQLDFMQTAAMEIGSSYQQTDDKLHGTEVNNDGDYPK